MTSDNSKIYTCKCGKTYKTRQPYIKHVGKCVISASTYRTDTENIQLETDDSNQDNEKQQDTEKEEEEKPRIRKYLAPDAEYLAQVDNDMKNDLQEFINSDGKLPPHEPLEGENITVNTLVIETLLKTVLSQVLLHHHRHTQSIVDQNTKLIEENKMLVRMVRTIMYTKNNIKYEIDIQSDDENDKEKPSTNSDSDNNTDDDAINA
tara:strand:+ start:4656 stop:5273 length:618 start_codon:yes stop_codon:yes gene_type:complete